MSHLLVSTENSSVSVGDGSTRILYYSFVKLIIEEDKAQKIGQLTSFKMPS